MATISITSIIAIIVFKVMKKISVEEKTIDAIISFIVVAGIFIGVFTPISGYEENKILFKRMDLVPYEQENEFLKTTSSKVYYQYEYTSKVTDEEETTKECIEDSIKKEKATIIKTNEQDAKLEIRWKKAKKSIWTLGICIKKEYIFYVPN